MVGRVLEVFIPEQYRNGELLDIMARTNIGFKVLCDGELEEIILEQDEFNTKIMKDDLVKITKQTIDGKNFTDIELME